MPPESGDVEITLAAAELRLKVSPYGASLRGLWRECEDGRKLEIITGYTGAKSKIGGQGDVLIPFSGRVSGGRYEFEGQTLQMICNDKEGPNAIHGFLRLVEWEVAEQSDQSVSFMTWLNADDHAGYPFSICASVTYSLDDKGMNCSFTIENIGDQTAPASAGFHPYFTVGSEWIDSDILQVPMEGTLEFENLIPTGKVIPVEGTKYDFRQPRPIDNTQFNTCFVNPIRDPDGLLRVHLESESGESAVRIWMDSAFNSIVLYSGDPLPETHRRRSLAIEPMTSASDAFNHPDWGLVRLAPAESFTGSWGVSV